jgi:hypothetical protein
MEEEIMEEMNRGDFVEVREDYLMQLEENTEYYKTAIRQIKDEIYGLRGLAHDYKETIDEIMFIVNELEEALN